MGKDDRRRSVDTVVATLGYSVRAAATAGTAVGGADRDGRVVANGVGGVAIGGIAGGTMGGGAIGWVVG